MKSRILSKLFPSFVSNFQCWEIKQQYETTKNVGQLLLKGNGLWSIVLLNKDTSRHKPGEDKSLLLKPHVRIQVLSLQASVLHWLHTKKIFPKHLTYVSNPKSAQSLLGPGKHTPVLNICASEKVFMNTRVLRNVYFAAPSLNCYI